MRSTYPSTWCSSRACPPRQRERASRGTQPGRGARHDQRLLGRPHRQSAGRAHPSGVVPKRRVVVRLAISPKTLLVTTPRCPLPEELLEGVADFRRMSLADWRAAGEALLDDQVPTLLLFDRSFDERGSATAGDDLVRGILARDDRDHVPRGAANPHSRRRGARERIS